jgi:preprotein translocase subunit SecG
VSGALNIVQIMLSIVLIVLILLQTRGPGFTGAFSSDSAIFRTRRGLEKTVFQLTILVAVVFLFVSILSALAA